MPANDFLLRAFMLFGAAFGLTLLLTPFVRRWALSRSFTDRPGGRRLDRDPLPKGGGIAIYLSFWIVMGFAAVVNKQFIALWTASSVLFIVGFADDWLELRWYVKLAGQTIAALIFALAGDGIAFVTHPVTGDTVAAGIWSVPLTVLWLVALANMFNVIDGLDGLTAGVLIIAAVPIIIVSVALGRLDAAAAAVIVAGASAGFLPHNFYPARIIMGDAGAMFLGFTLGAISVEGAVKGTTALALAASVLAFGFPILETLFSILRRTAQGKPFYEADMDHIHHRLLAKGFSHRQAVLTLYVVSMVMAWAAVKAFHTNVGGMMLILAGVGFGAVVFGKFVGGLKAHQDGASVSKHIPG